MSAISRQEATGWVIIGQAEGLLEAADLAAKMGHADVALAIRKRIPKEVQFHEDRAVDESGGMDEARGNPGGSPGRGAA